jgi:hypothetical protein
MKAERMLKKSQTGEAVKFIRISFLLSQPILAFSGMAIVQLLLISPIVANAEAASKIGDLSKFRKLVLEIEALVEMGNLAGAKVKIKDLETSWDEAEASLKPRAAADWHKVDKAIDRALGALKEAKPDADSCKKALAEARTAMENS